jgi:hypothetical protein
MKALKIVVTAALVYVGIVVAFESLIGIIQPTTGSTLVITTLDEDGNTNDRVLERLQSDDKLYVAVNHWPRAWYERALANPAVRVTLDGVEGDYTAVQLTGAERDRVDAEHSLPFFFRILTGFPERHIIRLDPR